MSPELKSLFEQLALRQEFVEWLAQEEAKQISVLKVNLSPVQLAQAQGAVQLIDRIKDAMKRNK